MNRKFYIKMLPIYLIVILSLIGIAFGGNRTMSVVSENAPLKERQCIVIDAGHGGIDGGAVSCTGVLESQINLEIALKLNDLFHLLGIKTKMIRTTDCSIYTQGNTIASQKISDLKERVRITNSTENGILISLHQNNFIQAQYRGAQVFYAQTKGSAEFAKQLQSSFVEYLNTGSNRKIKKSNCVYLMDHITCTGVLVECGFLSNPEEEAMLRNTDYQQKICCVIASAYSNYSNLTLKSAA